MDLVFTARREVDGATARMHLRSAKNIAVTTLARYPFPAFLRSRFCVRLLKMLRATSGRIAPADSMAVHDLATCATGFLASVDIAFKIEHLIAAEAHASDLAIAPPRRSAHISAVHRAAWLADWSSVAEMLPCMESSPTR